jgi:uncharacterized membrane protein
MEGAKRLAEGQSPARAVAGAAGVAVKEKVKQKVGTAADAAGQAVKDKVEGAAGGAGAAGETVMDQVKATVIDAVKDKVKDTVKGAFGRKRGNARSKSMNVVESVDVGVPVSVAYDQWTQFQDFSRFMKGVENVEQTSETEAIWRARVFTSRRTWKATITEQIPDRRIAWTSEGVKGSTQGVITFHPLGDDLTRVLVCMRYFPQGLVEKTGNLWRAAGRRTRLDLKNYCTFIMSEGEPTGSWRGEIHDGEVTQESDGSEPPENGSADNRDEIQNAAEQGPAEDSADRQQDAAQRGNGPRRRELAST